MKETPAVRWFLAALVTIASLIAFADRPISAWLAGLDDAWWDAYGAITEIGNSRWYLFGLPVVIGVALWRRGRAGGEKALVLDGAAGAAGFLFAAVALSGIATNVLKFLIGRARPKLWDRDGIYSLSPFGFDHDWQSFPSGHATTLFALAAALALLTPRWRPPLYALAALFALTRVAVHAHYPSDVLGGAAVGIASATVLARWLARRGLLFRLAADGRIAAAPTLAAAAAAIRRGMGGESR